MNFMINESEQKLRGGYYTPLDLAVYIARWTLTQKSQQVLEPSCGDGIFIQAIAELGRQKDITFTGFELSAAEAAKARNRAKCNQSLKTKINGEDFLQWALLQMVSGKTPFDAVVGNPPFIRYQYLPEDATA